MDRVDRVDRAPVGFICGLMARALEDERASALPGPRDAPPARLFVLRRR